MRYSDRIDLITKQIAGTGPNEKTVRHERKGVPCRLAPVTDTSTLSTYGLVGKEAFEVHLIGDVRASGVIHDGITYDVAKAIRGRLKTILIVGA